MLLAQGPAPDWPADRIARALQGPAAMLVLDFQPAARQCPRCGSDLHTQKSKTRTLSTLATGTFRARECRRSYYLGQKRPFFLTLACAEIIWKSIQFEHGFSAGHLVSRWPTDDSSSRAPTSLSEAA